MKTCRRTVTRASGLPLDRAPRPLAGKVFDRVVMALQATKGDENGGRTVTRASGLPLDRAPRPPAGEVFAGAFESRAEAAPPVRFSPVPLDRAGRGRPQVRFSTVPVTDSGSRS